MITGLLDLDAIKYICASVGQKTSIRAIQKTTGDEFLFKTRTEMYGRSKTKIGGWLETYNKEKDLDLVPYDFTIEDIVVPEPLPAVLHTVKTTVERIVYESKVDNWKGFLGEGDSFRVELSTLKKYKGERPDTKPFHFENVVEYLKTKYNPEITTHYETDDKLIMLANKKKDIVIMGNDKDYKTHDVNFYDINKPDDGIIDCSGLGELWLDVKGNVRGKGRLFKYFQIISEDAVDNYKANCFSDIAWGEKSAYKVLKDCINDGQAFEVMLETFQHLYSEPKKVIGWRQEEIEIDAMYVFQEMMNMAHLHRWENDFVNVKDCLDRFGINYE